MTSIINSNIPEQLICKQYVGKWDVTTENLKSVNHKLSIAAKIIRFLGSPVGWIARRQLMPPVKPKRVKESIEKFNTFWHGNLSLENTEIRNHFDADRISITTPDGVKLNAIWIHRKDQEKNIQTVVYFNGRSQLSTAERNNWILKQSLQYPDHPCNFLFFDYRGIGESQGTFATINDLVIDGSSAVQFLKNEVKVPSDQIHFYGYSLGGAIATKTKSLDAKTLTGRIVNERSFSSLEKIIQVWFRFLSFISTWIAKIAASQGFEINVTELWNDELKGHRKLIVYHPHDPIIPSVAGLFQKQPENETICLKLKEGSNHPLLKQPHNTPLFLFENHPLITEFLFCNQSRVNQSNEIATAPSGK